MPRFLSPGSSQRICHGKLRGGTKSNRTVHVAVKMGQCTAMILTDFGTFTNFYVYTWRV